MNNLTLEIYDVMEDCNMGRTSESNKKLLYSTIHKIMLDGTDESKMLEQDLSALSSGYSCDCEIYQTKLKHGVIDEDEFIDKMSKLTLTYYTERYNLLKDAEIFVDNGELALQFKRMVNLNE